MKKLLIMLMMVFSFLTISAQGFVRNGNDYTSSRGESVYIETPYTYHGKTIWINKTNGRCVTKTPSPTKKNVDGTPKINTSAVPEDIARDVARNVHIAYTYQKQTRK